MYAPSMGGLQYIVNTYIVKVAQSCPTLCDPMDYTVHGILQARTLEWVAFPFSRGLPTQGLNLSPQHCRQILYQLSHKGSPRILEWVAYLFSSRSSWPRNRTGISCTAGRFFTNWAIREAQYIRQIEVEITRNTVIEVDFNTPLTSMDRSSRQKISRA